MEVCYEEIFTYFNASGLGGERLLWGLSIWPNRIQLHSSRPLSLL